MKTNAPKGVVWFIAVIIGLLGVLGKIVVIPILTAYSWWLVLIGFVILALATLIKGL